MRVRPAYGATGAVAPCYLRSATALAQMLEQPLRGYLHQIQHFLKPVGPPVVRVGDLSNSSVGRKLKEQPQPITPVRRGSVMEHAQVLAIHSENEIEVFKIMRLDDPRAQRRHVVAASDRRLPRTCVRRLSNVIPSSARRIHLDHQLGCLTRRDGAEDGFRGRRAANIPEADEEDPHGPYFTLYPRPSRQAPMARL
jgi:hypothetical protein